jgi:hypothetical protein
MALQRYREILLSFNNNYYDDLGIVNFIDTDDMNTIKFSVKPFEGFHKDVEYMGYTEFQDNVFVHNI